MAEIDTTLALSSVEWRIVEDYIQNLDCGAFTQKKTTDD